MLRSAASVPAQKASCAHSSAGCAAVERTKSARVALESETSAASTVRPRRGEMVSHHGGLRHASVPTTAGRRYILVAFLRAPSLVVAPPARVTGYCATSRAAAARSRGIE